MTTRRQVIGGLAGAAFAGPMGWDAALAAPASTPLFAGAPLAGNALARHFHRVDMALPEVSVATATGRAPLSKVGGKTRLLSLWAEWCVPCLVEIRDFAALRPAVAGDTFDIGLLLTASTAKLDREGALAKLRPLGAAGLPLLIEPDGGMRAAFSLATPPDAPDLPGKGKGKGRGFSLPCTLIVDARGRVRGRSFGSPVMSAQGAPSRPALTEEQKAALKRGEKVVLKPITEGEKAELLATGRTMWASKDGKAFLEALAGGAMDRVSAG